MPHDGQHTGNQGGIFGCLRRESADQRERPLGANQVLNAIGKFDPN